MPAIPLSNPTHTLAASSQKKKLENQRRSLESKLAPLVSYSQGQFGGVFHGFRNKARADVKEIGLDQLLVERVVTRHIGHDRFHQIVDIATQSMHFENTWQLFNDALELAGPGRVVLTGFDGDKHRQTESQLALPE